MVSRDDAIRFLGDVPGDKQFWVHDGPALKNLQELADALRSMNDGIFNYHVNNEKNDFSSWVRDVIGYEKLANELTYSKSKESALRKIKDKIGSLKQKAS